MPRKRKLTWVRGAAGRQGRWRKKYRGKLYYFPGGKGKSDSEAYEAAVTAWEATKPRLDAAFPGAHYEAYQVAIKQWEQVLNWSRSHNDDSMTDRALEKLRRLRQAQRSRAKHAPPFEDLFESHFDSAIRFPNREEAYREFGRELEKVLRSQAPGDDLMDASYASTNSRADDKTTATIVPDPSGWDAPDELAIEKEVWRDRLDVMSRQAAHPDMSIKAHIKKFLDVQQAKVEASQITLGTLNKLQIHLSGFADWIGGDGSINSIDGQKLLNYHAHLLQQVSASIWTSSTASDHLGNVKSFVRWLWRTEAIETLPRMLDAGSRELEIGKTVASILVFTKAEIASLLAGASARTRLYILLSLNTAMTQKDIADLEYTEIDWEDGRIERKRSKTRTHANVPLVSYHLWPETLSLLSQERNPAGTGRVLINEDGGPLWDERTDINGKYAKVDNIRNAFDRLRRRLEIRKPFKSLKKTSATELAGNKEFRSVRGHFLGHAPSSLSDRHYAQAPAQLLDEAVVWLRERLDIKKTFDAIANGERARRQTK